MQYQIYQTFQIIADLRFADRKTKYDKKLFFTQRGQHVVQILLVDETVSVLVDHVERLFKLLDLRLVKHGKHVGGGPLRALLGGLSLGAFARHGGGWIWACAHLKGMIHRLDHIVC